MVVYFNVGVWRCLLSDKQNSSHAFFILYNLPFWEFGVIKLFIKMSISANTLFHFVSQRKFLESILHGKLIPRYCVEHFEINDNFKGDVAIPMKCFCDIPLSQIYEHTNTYGKFAIGFTKEWAQKVGITPVLYIHNQSPHIQNIFPKSQKNFLSLCKKKSNNKICKTILWKNVEKRETYKRYMFL